MDKVKDTGKSAAEKVSETAKTASEKASEKLNSENTKEYTEKASSFISKLGKMSVNATKTAAEKTKECKHSFALLLKYTTSNS